MENSTFNKLATVGLTGGDLESDDMTLLDRSSLVSILATTQSVLGNGVVFTNLSLIEKLDGNTNCGSHVGGCVDMSWGFGC